MMQNSNNEWIYKTVGEICLVTAGQSPNGSNYNKEKIGLPFFQGKKDFTDKYIGSPTTWTTQITKTALKNDILMSVRAPVGPINIAREECCIGRGLASIRCRDEINREFLFNYLQYYEKKIIGNNGAVFNSINKSQIENIVIPVPSLQEQLRIVKILDEVFEGIDKAKKAVEKNINNSEELFESYLEQIFSNTSTDWEFYKLKDCTRFIDYRGKTPIKTQQGIPLITAKNVKKGFIKSHPKEFIDFYNYDTWMTRGIPRLGDILFTTEAPLGNVAQLDIDGKVAFAQRIIIIQPESTLIHNVFLKYLLLSKPYQDLIREKGTGATVLGIKSKLLKEITISIPSIKTQKSIATKLNKLYLNTRDLQQLYSQKLTLLEELKRSVLHKAFNGEL